MEKKSLINIVDLAGRWDRADLTNKNTATKTMTMTMTMINIVDLAGRWDRARYLIQSRTTPLFNEGSKKCWCWSYFGSLGKEVTAYSAFPRFRLFNSIKITRLYVLCIKALAVTSTWKIMNEKSEFMKNSCNMVKNYIVKRSCNA